jgi:hypothetical protein
MATPFNDGPYKPETEREFFRSCQLLHGTDRSHISGGAALSPDGIHLAVWDLCQSIVIYNVHNRDAPETIISIPQISPFDNTINVELDMEFVNGGQDILIGSNVGQPVVVNVVQRRVTGMLEHSPSMSLDILACDVSEISPSWGQHHSAYCSKRTTA